MGLLDAVKKVILGEDEPAEADSGAKPEGAAAPPAAGGDDIEQRLRAMIAEQSDGQLTAEEIPADAPLLDDGILDSLSSSKLLVFIEEQYGVEIQESELPGRLDTLAALVTHVTAHRAPAQPASSDA